MFKKIVLSFGFLSVFSFSLTGCFFEEKEVVVEDDLELITRFDEKDVFDDENEGPSGAPLLDIAYVSRVESEYSLSEEVSFGECEVDDSECEDSSEQGEEITDAIVWRNSMPYELTWEARTGKPFVFINRDEIEDLAVEDSKVSADDFVDMFFVGDDHVTDDMVAMFFVGDQRR